MAGTQKSIEHLIGLKFSQLTILQDIGMLNGQRMVKVICDCGKEKYMKVYEIVKGINKACGCNIKSKESEYLNKKYERLTILSTIGTFKGKTIVKAECECGHVKEYKLGSILSGNSKSCGCLCLEKTLEKVRTHGMSKHPLMSVWGGMIDRCYNENNKSYHNYGGRGVTVCEEWKTFVNFFNWARDKWKAGLELDKEILSPVRPSMLYCPEYCLFVTRKVNGRNKNNAIVIEYNGKSQGLPEWSDELGIKYQTLRARIRDNGWSVEKAFTKPVKKTAA